MLVQAVMKTAVQTWVSGRLATAVTAAYWRILPMRSLGKLLAAAFITFFGIGFVFDLLLLNYQPLARGFFWPVFSGTLGTAGLAVRMRRLRLFPILLLIIVVGLWLGVRVSFRSSATIRDISLLVNLSRTDFH